MQEAPTFTESRRGAMCVSVVVGGGGGVGGARGAAHSTIENKKDHTSTPPGKQKAARSFRRMANLFPGGYLKSIYDPRR